MSNDINVLYVDDNVDNLMLFKAGFSRKFNVFIAESGMEGLDMLRDVTGIIVVISDFKMPEMNGLEFIKKAREKYSDISYFILTAFNINDDIQEALDTKMIVHYLKKPFDFPEIEKYIRMCGEGRFN